MKATRVVLMLLGVLAGGYGAWLLWDRSDTDALVSTGIWLIGGVVLHDVVISAIVIVLGVVATRLLPVAARAPGAIALIIVGPLTLIAFPMIGGFGVKDDNPTLLDRPYMTSWVVLLVVTIVLVVTASLARSRAGAGERTDPSADQFAEG